MRLMYELVLNKAKSQRDKPSYQLLRKETYDIENVKMKVSEFDYEKSQKKVVRTYVIADTIKAMYVEYVTYKKEDKEKKEQKTDKSKETQQEIRSFTWGEKEDSKGVVPHRIEVRVDFWNDAMTRHHTFQTTIPVWSYPTVDEKEKKKKDGVAGGAGEVVGGDEQGDDEKAGIEIKGPMVDKMAQSGPS